MKKIIYIIFIMVFSMPALASCPLTGVCAAPADSALNLPSLNDKYMPNNLNNMQKPNAFQPKIIEPYNESMVDFGENPQQTEENQIENQVQYDADCQFGVCLP